MKITKANEENRNSFLPEGWLDTEAAPALGEEIKITEGTGEIVIDFDKAEYMLSSGLRQGVAVHRKAKEQGAFFSVVNAHPEIMGIFLLTGSEKSLP